MLCAALRRVAVRHLVRTSDGSMSVFEVGIGFRYFSVFLKSVRYSVSVFQITAISVSVLGIFTHLHYFKSVHSLCVQCPSSLTSDKLQPT